MVLTSISSRIKVLEVERDGILVDLLHGHRK